jgi:hypothetical protein
MEQPYIFEYLHRCPCRESKQHVATIFGYIDRERERPVVFMNTNNPGCTLLLHLLPSKFTWTNISFAATGELSTTHPLRNYDQERFKG